MLIMCIVGWMKLKTKYDKYDYVSKQSNGWKNLRIDICRAKTNSNIVENNPMNEIQITVINHLVSYILHSQSLSTVRPLGSKFGTLGSIGPTNWSKIPFLGRSVQQDNTNHCQHSLDGYVHHNYKSTHFISTSCMHGTLYSDSPLYDWDHHLFRWSQCWFLHHHHRHPHPPPSGVRVGWCRHGDTLRGPPDSARRGGSTDHGTARRSPLWQTPSTNTHNNCIKKNHYIKN